MGYNGNNRRLRSSVIRKSSLNFGTKLVSNVIAIPAATVFGGAFTKRNSKEINTKIIAKDLLGQNMKKTIKIPLDTLLSIGDNKYKYIIADLVALIKDNLSLEKKILLKNEELKTLKLKRRLFMLFPRRRKKIEIDINRVINEVKDLNSRRQTEVLNVKDLRNVRREEKIYSLKEQLSSSKLSISNDSISLFDVQRICNSFILNRVEAQISFESNIHISHCPALTITAPYMDLFFLGMGIVIKCGEVFAVVGYADINLKYHEVRIKEDEYFNVDGYILDSYTFLYSKNDGEADLRYSYNPRIPIIKYGKLSLEMSKGLTLNLFFDNYAIGFQLYEAINTVSYFNPQDTEEIDNITEISQCEVGQNIPKKSSEKSACPKSSDGFDVIVDLSDLCNNEMSELLANADRLVENKKYNEANTLYNKLLGAAIIQNNSLYNGIAVSRLKDLENNKTNTSLWNEEMHKLLAKADSLMEDKKYEEAKKQYNKLLDIATLCNYNSLYNCIATERLKELKNKMDLLEACSPNSLFNIEMINEIIEDAKFHEAKKDYKKALSKYIEVKMYGIMYSSLPYIDLAKTEIEKLKKLEK